MRVLLRVLEEGGRSLRGKGVWQLTYGGLNDGAWSGCMLGDVDICRMYHSSGGETLKWVQLLA